MKTKINIHHDFSKIVKDLNKVEAENYIENFKGCDSKILLISEDSCMILDQEVNLNVGDKIIIAHGFWEVITKNYHVISNVMEYNVILI